MQIDASHIPEGPTPEADVDVSDKIQTVIMDSEGPLEEENVGATATGHADALFFVRKFFIRAASSSLGTAQPSSV